MERRVLLGVTLSFLVLFISQGLFVRPAQKSAQKAASKTGAAAVPGGSGTVPPGGQPEASSGTAELDAAVAQAGSGACTLVGDTEERDIVVVNAEVRAVLSSRGATLKSWRLKRFFDDRKRPIDLVSDVAPASEPPPFALTTGDEALDARLRGALYKALAHYELARLHAWHMLEPGQAHMTRALDHCRQAITGWTRAGRAVDLANARDLMGTLYRHQLGGDRQENLRQARQYHQAALDTLESYRQTEALAWARVQHNIGTTLYQMYDLSAGSPDLLDKALVHFQNALAVRQRQTDLEQWAATLHNMAVIYLKRPHGQRAASVEQAIGWLTDILTVRTRTSAPAEWAELPQGVEPLQADPERVRWLFDSGKRLVDTAGRQPALFDNRSCERIAAAHTELLEALLATLGGADDYAPTRDDRTRQAQGLIVKKAEDYVLTRAGDHVSVSDLCRFAAVSERALQNAFKEVLGLTPVAYLNRLRLHRVREALLEATQGSTTVSAEALKWGFWHFGEFSHAYKDCFGELPSDTLRRNPVKTQP